MFSLLLHPPPEREDFLIADLQECGTAGLVEEDAGLRAFFENDRSAVLLQRHFAEFSPAFRQEEFTDWERVTRDAWPPLNIGERFYLVAPWHNADAEPTPPGRLRLEIYPGMACGTGRHPATQLCLQAMERYLKPGARVLDVGSGSGILSGAASLLGAACVIACDIDPDAVPIVRERVNVPMFIGSADAVRSRWADVIVANIDATTLERIAPELERVRGKRSTLILSGFPESDVPEGFSPKEVLRQKDDLCQVWCCLVC
ncbi:MAG: 50S ribosomal protein L11 methyltransferase [Bryobacterales bacterium]|nr:50S ribosomal protein L11 methyltransferase [Bryobacterales bacterium]